MRALGLFVAIFAAVGCGQSAAERVRALEKIESDVASRHSSVDHLDRDDFAELRSRDSVTVVDTRERGEYEVSHIAGAIRVDPSASSAEIAAALGDVRGKDVVFYCSVGERSSIAAARAQDALRSSGAKAIHNLRGGIFGWHNDHRPLVDDGGPTAFVHPFNAKWAVYLTRQDALRPLGSMTAMTEVAIRLGAFLAIFILFAILERAIPRRRLALSRGDRWFTNLSITAIGAALARALALTALPITGLAAAWWAQARGFGLLAKTELPLWTEVIIAVVALDFAIWLQHVLTHLVGPLWRLHRVHHADRDLDVTTALRFHPLEIGLSLLYKAAIVIALGPSIVAVLIFEIILNGCSIFNHANLRIGGGLDRALRSVVVTPAVHGVHHSTIRSEHNSNFGFSVTLWDRIFRTYKAPQTPTEPQTVGLPGHQSSRPAHLGWSLAFPFRD